MTPQSPTQASRHQGRTPAGDAQPRDAHLVDFLFARLACERSTFAIHGKLLERFRQAPAALAETGLSPTDAEAFHTETSQHVNLLVQSLDILNGEREQARSEAVESSQSLMQALQGELDAPSVHPLKLLHGLLTAARLNEAAWELLLVLVKDADITQLIPYFEQACRQYGEQRARLQQCYEDLSLNLVRRAGSAIRPKNVASPTFNRIRNHGLSVFFTRRKAGHAQA
jgi:hypothetical protein